MYLIRVFITRQRDLVFSLIERLVLYLQIGSMASTYAHPDPRYFFFFLLIFFMCLKEKHFCLLGFLQGIFPCSYVQVRSNSDVERYAIHKLNYIPQVDYFPSVHQVLALRRSCCRRGHQRSPRMGRHMEAVLRGELIARWLSF